MMYINLKSIITSHILLVIQKVFILLIWFIFYLWWPTSNSSISGVKWFITFIDGCTHVTWIFLVKEKFEVFTSLSNSST